MTQRAPTGPMITKPPAWSQEEIDRLYQKFTVEGKSIRTVGDEMHRSRNSIMSKVDRLRELEGEERWPARGSPIIRSGPPERPHRRCRVTRGVSTLPPLSSLG